MDIVSGVLPIPGGTPAGCWQHANLLVVANGFCRHTSSASELANRQRSFHGCSSLYDVSAQKGTRSTCWKVKGLGEQTENCLCRVGTEEASKEDKYPKNDERSTMWHLVRATITARWAWCQCMAP